MFDKLASIVDMTNITDTTQIVDILSVPENLVFYQTKYLFKHQKIFQRFLAPYEEAAEKIGLQRTKNIIKPFATDYEKQLPQSKYGIAFERCIEWRLIPGFIP